MHGRRCCGTGIQRHGATGGMVNCLKTPVESITPSPPYATCCAGHRGRGGGEGGERSEPGEGHI